MNQVQLPVFVRRKDCGDIVRYHSVAKMQSDFVQIDVENEEYEAWDAAGTRLRMRVQSSSEWLRIESSPKPQLDQLAEAITRLVRVQGVDVDVSLLREGDFSGALDQISSAVQFKWQSRNWGERLKRRF
jgi:hypothetical protein